MPKTIISFAVILSAGLSMLFTVSPLQAAPKRDAVALRSEATRQPAPKQITVRKITASQEHMTNQNFEAPLLSTSLGALCNANLSGDVAWVYTGWVIGEEIYKAYQDPELVCPGAYPFTITEAHIILGVFPDLFMFPLGIPMSVDIELVDVTTEPGCTRPGAKIFVGSPGIVTITDAGLWDITIAIDPPIVVTGPYFVGVNFDAIVSLAMGIQLTSDDFETLCVTFNKWDEDIGFIDLGNDSIVYTQTYLPTDPCFSAEPNDPACFSFNGRLNMWTVGTTGGVVTPDLAVDFLGPRKNEVLFGSVDMWVIETSALGIGDSAVFYWGTGNARNRIGVDSDGALAPSSAGTPGPGRGFSYDWDFSALQKQTVFIKVELFDTLSRSVADSVLVTLEPLSPTPVRTTPAYFSDFCAPITASYDLVDDDLFFWQALRKPAEAEHRKNLGTFDQSLLGNLYGGPAVGALALEYWFNNGFQQSMQIGGGKLTLLEAADRLGDFMRIPENGSLEDDWFVFGFQSYLAVTGFAEQKLDFTHAASYATLRNWAEEIGSVVMFSVSGLPGRWLAVDGFSPQATAEGVFRVVVSDPTDALTKTIFWRDTQSGAEVFVDNDWRTVALMTRLLPSSWAPAGRMQFDLGVSPTSPFSLLLDGSDQGLVDGNLYFFTLSMTDISGNTGEETVLLQYTCNALKAGDYDGDGLSTVADLVFLIDFLLFNGPDPVGGAGRANVNCVGGIDTADLVHFSNWLFAGGVAPCQ